MNDERVILPKDAVVTRGRVTVYVSMEEGWEFSMAYPFKVPVGINTDDAADIYTEVDYDYLGRICADALRRLAVSMIDGTSMGHVEAGYHKYREERE